MEYRLKKLFTIIRLLILLVFAAVLGLWGSLNGHLVKWHLMVQSEAVQLQMSVVMAVLLLSGFVLGMLTSFYVMSRMKFAQKLKQRQANKAVKKLEQNQAVAQQPSQETHPVTTSP